MKKWILLLTLCISLLLSGCQKTPEAQPGTQPAEAPWADEQADAPLSYEDYFAELRPYDPAENDVPDWMKDGNYEILSEDGVLALYQAANGSLILKASMIPAAAAMLLIIPGETGNHPFDAAEAETEICEGMLAEYSGAPLGVYKLNHAIKMLTLTSLFVALFLGGIGGGIEKFVALIGLTGGAAAGMTMLLGIVILLLLCIALTAVSISFVHAITARLKIEQIFKYYWTVVSGLALISLVLAWYGM